jgi:hypothetical protein
LAAIMLSSCLAGAQNTPAQSPAESAFTGRTASTLLRQLSESLQGHSEKNFLALFHLPRMKEAPLFKQQIDAFFSQAESIAVHLNLAETNAASSTMAVDAEMEVQPGNGGAPVRRREQVVFTAARAGKGWKFIDVQPRGFFSLP